MTPASARDLRRARVARLRRDEPDLSQRDLAQRLGISKDTVRRDLEALDAEVAQTAPQVSEEAAPPAATVAPSAPVPPLPVRQADPLADMDVSQWRALRRDLAILAQTGRAPETLVHQAVVAVAHSYRQALAAGELEPGDGFLITGMTLRPRAQLADQPVA